MAQIQARIEAVTGDDAPLLRSMATLYESAFPASERKPAGFLQSAARHEDYSLLALLCDRRVEGLAVVYRSPSGRFALLEYLAVSAGARGRGLGSALFKAVVAANGDRTLLVEVEAEKEGDPSCAGARRRKAFYRNLGCREIQGLDYRMPPVGSDRPPPMSLMACGGSGPGIETETIRTWLGEIFCRVYSVAEPEAAVGEMLAGLPERVGLA